jgi:hypothetical protein
MDRRFWIGAIVASALLTSGCAGAAAGATDGSGPRPFHVMPDGTEMPGSEHDAHAPGGMDADAPSEAAQMVCAGSVVTAVTKILGLSSEPSPTSEWDAPMYSCSFDVDGDPLLLTVHDVADAAEGEAHFADAQQRPGAREIEGLLGLGMPSFSTGDGVVGFLRDGKTLLVDATALPDGLGPDGTRTQDQVAYAVASAVLTCWVDHS